MGLSLMYEFVAPASVTAEVLETFLRNVEHTAQSLGFRPTTVLNIPFNTPERREFSRRLGGSYTIQADGLKGVVLPAEGQIRNHNAESGECRLVPSYGVVLVVTDEHGHETCFGFFRYPARVLDTHGRELADTMIEGWRFRDFVNSPDPRFRLIIDQFANAGFVASVKDDFV